MLIDGIKAAITEASMDEAFQAVEPGAPESFFDDKEVVLECDCIERGNGETKIINRKVWFMPLSRENLILLWEKVKQYNVLFNEEIRNDYEKFVNHFLHQNGTEIKANGLVYIVDDFVGMYYMTRIVPNNDALVHFTFFDGRLKGRLSLTRKMLGYGFETSNFRRFSVEIAYYARPVVRTFVEDLGGFRSEGIKRSIVKYNDVWYDLKLYAIFRQDLKKE